MACSATSMTTKCSMTDSSAAGSRSFAPGTTAIAGGRRSLAANLSVVCFSKGVTILTGLLTLGYAARTLGPAMYGMWACATALTAYATILLSPGLMVWGTRTIARHPERAGRTLLIVNGTQFCLAILAYGGLTAFALFAVHSGLERTIILLASLSLFTEAWNVDWVFAGLERLALSALVGMFLSVGNALALVGLVRSPGDVLVYTALPVSLGLCGIVGGHVLLYREGLRMERPDAGEIIDALADSLPLGAAMALVVVLHHANKLIVYGLLGAEAAGLFAAAFRLVDVAAMFPAVLGGVFLPRLARMVRQSSDRAADEARTFARVHMLVAFPVAAVLICEAPSLVGLLFGRHYLDAVGSVRILSLAVLFNFAICSQTNCLISYGKDREMLAVVVVSTVVSIVGGLFLVPWLGLAGAACAVSGVDLAGWLVSLRSYRQALGRWNLDVWLAPMLGAGLLAMSSQLLQNAGAAIPIRVAIGAALYGACVWPSLRILGGQWLGRTCDCGASS